MPTLQRTTWRTGPQAHDAHTPHPSPDVDDGLQVGAPPACSSTTAPWRLSWTRSVWTFVGRVLSTARAYRQDDAEGEQCRACGGEDTSLADRAHHVARRPLRAHRARERAQGGRGPLEEAPTCSHGPPPRSRGLALPTRTRSTSGQPSCSGHANSPSRKSPSPPSRPRSIASLPVLLRPRCCLSLPRRRWGSRRLRRHWHRCFNKRRRGEVRCP